MKGNLTKRMLSLLLVIAMVLGLAAPVGAAGHSHAIAFSKVDAPSSLEVIGQTTAAPEAAPEHADEDLVRVSIVLEEASTLHAGFSTMDVADNAAAMAYRSDLKTAQQDLTARIERTIGSKLDVVWNLTLAANLISANVRFGDISKIEAVPGVGQVILENVYEPAVVADSAKEELDPNQISSTIMTGSVNVWQSGYTGAGSRVAVIDTGIDVDHQSFSAKGLEYSLALNAEAEGMTYEEYAASLELLDEEEIASKLDQLNVQGLRSDRLYYSSKIPFGYNYIDRNYKVTHDYDEQGEHGSHVEGIAAANSYIPLRDGTFAEALEYTNVKGQAPDAQIISMKVFGANGGAYDSDYMAAIEDAIILGADSVNLSLGSGSAGFSFNFTYAELLSSLQKTDTVVTISAGNSYAWDDDAEHTLYAGDIRFSTNGSPGSYSNSLGVASVESTFFNEDGSYTAPEFYEMSDFSSWGIPESLELKPEITAPGGNIYSVNGAVAGGKSYESMSGTSMAAPQMAGIAAVMAQYIRDNDLTAKTGLTVRQLTQSLLMSTAQALLEEDTGYWYSVLKQGSGMARLDLATTARTYILMGDDATAYAADGKIKAELGDDPDKTGEYGFSFSINNFGAEDASFKLHTDLFTQYSGGTYLYSDTDPLSAEVSYLVDGVRYDPIVTAFQCDLNADGVTDAADAQLILDYTVGSAAEIDAMADLDTSGAVDAYDAHLILAGLETGEFTVPAGSSVTVEVTAALTAEQKAKLDADHPNGAYIEGFVFASGDVEHSIPVLGFYGNWSDPGMFGASYTEVLYGDDREPYFGTEETNNLVTGRNGQLSLHVGNPYLVEDSYPAGKAAVRSDDLLDSYRLALLRNAGAMMLSITDGSGSELYNSGVTNQKHGAYYYVNGGEWRNTSADYVLGFTASSLGLKENDAFRICVTAVPEYYTMDQLFTADMLHALADSGVLGSGTTLTTELVVDDTAPEILSIARDISTDELVVTIRDNQYPAALRIVDAKGTVHATQAIDCTGAAGSLQQVVLELDGVTAGDPCYISVGDYAANEAVYEAHLGLEEPGAGGGTGGGSTGALEGNMYGFSAHTASGWVQLDIAGGKYDLRAKANVMVEAAEYVDGYVFLVASDGTAYVAPHTNPTALVKLNDLSAYGVEDMTFNYLDNQMYVLGADNTVYTMNLSDASLTEAFTISVVNTKNAACTKLQALAVDEEGNFYTACHGGDGYEFAAQIFKFTLDMVADGAITDLNPIGSGYIGGYTDNGQTLSWDYENDKLYYYSWGRYDIDTFGTVYLASGGVGGIYSVDKIGLTSIYFPGRTANVIDFATEAESLTVGTTELKMLEGSSTSISVSVAPWTLQDQSLTWTSSDESVVSVSNGVVTALNQGNATVTVTTNAEPHLSAEIDITVSGLPQLDLYAMLLDADGNPTWVKFNAAAPEAWEAVGANQGTDSYGAVNMNDVIYVHDGSTLYAMNPDTFTKEAVTGIGSDFAWMDAAATPFDRLVAPCYAGSGVAVIDPEGDELTVFDLSAELGADLLVTMAYAFEEDGVHTLYSVAESGNVYEISLTVNDEADYDLTAKLLCASPVELPASAEVGYDSTAGSVYDAASGTLVIAAYAEGDSTGYVYAVEPNGGASLVLGNIGDDVWPFYSLYTYDAPTELTLRCRTEELFLYKGDEATITASVSPLRFTGGLTFTVADERVASIDENGHVIALAPGDTTITISTVDTTADGNVLTKVIPLHVEDTIDMDLTVNAKLDFDDEGSKWVTIHTSDVKNPEIIADDHSYLASAAVHDGIIYAGDDKIYIDWNYWAVVCNLYVIEPEYDYDITPGGLIGYENMPTDMSTMPALELTALDAEGNEVTIVAGDLPIYMDVSEQLIMWDVEGSDELASLSGWNLAGSFDGTPGALTFLGMTTQTDDEGTEYDAWSYAVLTTTGELYTINIIAYLTDGVVDYSAYIHQVGNVGLRFDYGEYMHMIYVNDGVNTGLLVGYTDSVAELYYVDLGSETITSGKIGSIPGTNKFGGMYFPEELNASNEAPAAFASQGELVQTAAKVGPDRSCTVPAKLSNDRLSVGDGSLNAVQVQATAEASENTLRLNLTEEVNTVSGMVTVTYDAEVLTYTGTSSALLTAEKAEEGKLTLAYANGTEIAAGELLASLNFTVNGDYVSTEITVDTLQRNAEGILTGENTTVTVELEPNGHSWAETERVDATCTEDGSVTYVCDHCGESYTEVLAALGHSYEATVTAPTCTEGGFTTYTCSVCGDSYVDDYTDALGHSYTQTVLEPTCTTAGYTVNTCACGCEYITDVIQPTGHSYEAVVTKPTCTEPGYTTYTCAVCGESHVGDYTAPHCVCDIYSDVAADDWFHEAVEFAVDEGLMNGMSESIFNPEGTMNRAQMVTVLYRLAGSPAVAESAPFTDVPADTFYTDAVAWAYANGIVMGVSADKFAPDASVTREQMVTFFARFAAWSGLDVTAEGDLSAYTDADAVSDWAVDAFVWATEIGLVNGVTATTLEPASFTNRAQIATILMRYCGMTE